MDDYTRKVVTDFRALADLLEGNLQVDVPYHLYLAHAHLVAFIADLNMDSNSRA